MRKIIATENLLHTITREENNARIEQAIADAAEFSVFFQRGTGSWKDTASIETALEAADECDKVNGKTPWIVDDNGVIYLLHAAGNKINPNYQIDELKTQAQA